MTGKDIYRNMSGLDPRFAEEAAPQEQPEKKRRFLGRGTAAACAALVCAVGIVGAAMLYGQTGRTESSAGSTNGIKTEEVQRPAGAEAGNRDSTEEVQRPAGTEAGNRDSGELCWQEKTVSCSLYEALQTGGTQVLSVRASVRADRDFLYQGKTIAAYEAAAEKERNFPEVLGQLLKEGEELRHGEALYRDAAPDGTRWSREFYEERVAFYGQEVLNRYIRDGRFASEQVQADLEAYDRHEAQDQYRAACDSFIEQELRAAEKQLSGQKLRFERSGEGRELILYGTAEEFAAFRPENPAAWTYTLANEDGHMDFAADAC